MAYPDGIDAMPTFTDGSGPTDLTPSAVLTAAEMTTITSAVTRTQSELGLAPSGPDATVRARLDRIESEVAGKADGSVAVTDAELAAALAGKAASVRTPTQRPTSLISRRRRCRHHCGAGCAADARRRDCLMPRGDMIVLRRDTLANWAAAEVSGPALAAGERGHITDLNVDVVGDGAKKVAQLTPVGSGTYARWPSSAPASRPWWGVSGTP